VGPTAAINPPMTGRSRPRWTSKRLTRIAGLGVRLVSKSCQLKELIDGGYATRGETLTVSDGKHRCLRRGSNTKRAPRDLDAGCR